MYCAHSLEFSPTLIFSQHTSLAAPCRCTAKHIRAYFQEGILPSGGTICEPDLIPFEKYNMTNFGVDLSEDEELDFALLKLMHAPVVFA
jgi:hypothetical protein